MAEGQQSNDWGWLFWVAIALAGGYWLLSDDGAEAPPPVITPSASAVAVENVLTPSTPNVAPAPPPVEKPNYSFVEDGVYGYVAGISEEEQKQGKAAGDVLLYRYAGMFDGKLRLEHMDPAGNIVAVSECSRPCVAIKMWSSSGIKQFAYNPGSVIGAAYEDALKGRLKRKTPPRALPPPVPKEPVEDKSMPTESEDVVAPPEAETENAVSIVSAS